jgi:general stress protein 26
MPSPHELEAKFWNALKSDRTVMLGVEGVDDRHARPMTALVEGEKSPLWIFTARDSELVRNLRNGAHADATFASKGHDLFATIHGRIALDVDAAAIDRLWNPFVAAWFKGKDDPDLALLRFDADRAEIWLDDFSLVAGVKMLLGIDPKKDYKDKMAEVSLR